MQPLDPFTMPLNGRRFIEASAGTGKTWTLTLLMLRMIVEQGLGIEQILVLTYTRAATAELRSRIRSRLREAQMQWQGKNPAPDPAIAQVLAAAPPEAAGLRLQHALARMDEAAITTIHGFCQKVTKEHAFEAGFSFDQNIVSDEAELREEIMADFWRKRFYPLGPEESALVQSHWPAPKDLLAAIANTLMIEDACMLPRLEADAMPRQVEALQQGHSELQQAWKKDGTGAQDWLEKDTCLSRAEKNYRADQVAELMKDLAALLLNSTFPRLLPQRLHLLCVDSMRERIKKNARIGSRMPFSSALPNSGSTIRRCSACGNAPGCMRRADILRKNCTAARKSNAYSATTICLASSTWPCRSRKAAPGWPGPCASATRRFWWMSFRIPIQCSTVSFRPSAQITPSHST